MKKLLVILLVVLVSFQTYAQKRKKIPSEKPRLIVVLMVEGMSYEFLSRYDHLFGEDGFKRLVNEGTVCTHAFYDYSFIQSAPAYATLTTGAMPSVHGIISDEWFTRNSELLNNGVREYKPSNRNIPGADISSPQYILPTTFSDELCLYNNHKSKVYSISLDPKPAVMLGGHTVNLAFWFNTSNGEWEKLAYCQDTVPPWVAEFNVKKIADVYLDRQWNPALPIEQYSDNKNVPLPFKIKNGFPYDLLAQRKKTKDYSQMYNTPFGNSITKDFAIATIVNENLGKDDDCDVLAVSFSAAREIILKYGINSVELEDTYTRLDKEIAHFLTFIDETIEKQDVLVMLTSDFGTSYTPDYLSSVNIPSGNFDSDRALTLVRSYLNAVYGKGNWIQNYSNLQIYLDRNLIEDSKLDLIEMQNRIAQFVVQFSGISNAVTANSLESSHFDKGYMAKVQNSYHQKRSGDILLVLEPGWVEKNDLINNGAIRFNVSPHVPLIWYGWKIKRQVLHNSILINDVAPTLCNFLGVPFPNGNQGQIINQLTE